MPLRLCHYAPAVLRRYIISAGLAKGEAEQMCCDPITGDMLPGQPVVLESRPLPAISMPMPTVDQFPECGRPMYVKDKHMVQVGPLNNLT